MKHLHFIALMFLVLVLACNRPVETHHGTSLPSAVSPQLQAIDSLMWTRPDSALARIMPWLDTCRRDVARNVSENNGDSGADVARYVSTIYDRHYAHLLLAELLYKNDYPQTNREELLRAVAYFDSLTIALNDNSQPRNRHCGLDPQSPDLNDNLVFLDARAHYINGVGYYERDSVVEACKEYLKALEVMEAHFEEKELVGHKARFMAYTYNRLGDLFSEQFMMEPAIASYENALHYCRIEPTSPQGVSNIFTRLGIQYDKLGDKEKMRDCYGHALEAMPSSDNLSYRNLAASKALCDYQLGLGIDHSLAVLRQILVDTDDEEERKTRFLTIGAVFAEEGIYDSAMYYLEPLFENENDIALKIPAAECLRNIYESTGDNEKLDRCLRFMAIQKKSEAQNKALVSQLDELFKSYMNQKLKNEAERAREKSIRKTIEVIVPIAIVMATAILIVAKLRNKKLLKEQKAEAYRMLGETKRQHQEELEAERQTHRMEQAAMSGRLKRSNQELRELKDQIKQLDDLAAKTEVAASFDEEPICRLILERVKEGQFKSKVNYINYKDFALSKSHLLDLRLAADLHFNQFTRRLKTAYPKITNTDLDYCCLYLLGLTDSDVAALMQRSYNTVIERNGKMRKIFGSNRTLPTTLMEIANDSHQFD